MTTCKIYFVTKDVLTVVGITRDAVKGNYLYLQIGGTTEYIVNMDKVLYIESEE